jgi:hypothetical protein
MKLRILIAGLLLPLSPPLLGGGGDPPLFLSILDASPTPPARTLSAFPVQINFAALDNNPVRIALNLPGSGTFVATRTRFVEFGPGRYQWVGKTSKHDVLLSVDDDLVTGFVRGGGDTYSVLSSVSGGGGASQSLQRMDEAAFPGDISDLQETGLKAIPSQKGADEQEPEGRCIGQAVDPIEVLVVYSPQALAAAGGDVAVLSNQIDNAILGGTITLANSNVPVSLQLAALVPAPASLVEEGDTDDYFNIRGNADVAALREQFRADTVTYLVSVGQNGPNTYCGVTSAMRLAGTNGYGYDYRPFAFNVVTWQCGVQNNDLSHETGHNVGLDHNPGFTSVTPADALFPYAFGHSVDGQFRDDMSGTSAASCPNGCPRQMFFSDPTQNFSVNTPRGISNQRDNAQAYRRMSRCVNTFATYLFGDGLEGG